MTGTIKLVKGLLDKNTPGFSLNHWNPKIDKRESTKSFDKRKWVNLVFQFWLYIWHDATIKASNNRIKFNINRWYLHVSSGVSRKLFTRTGAKLWTNMTIQLCMDTSDGGLGCKNCKTALPELLQNTWVVKFHLNCKWYFPEWTVNYSPKLMVHVNLIREIRRVWINKVKAIKQRMPSKRLIKFIRISSNCIR